MRRLILAAALSLSALTASAATLAGVTLEDHATVNNQHLMLNGMGLRKKFIVKVYVGGLYLPAKQSNAATVIATDQPRRMVMHFLYSVDKEQMCTAWEEGLTQNTPKAGADVKFLSFNSGGTSVAGFSAPAWQSVCSAETRTRPCSS